jgi:uncharacterized damage-inducible protein DinB
MPIADAFLAEFENEAPTTRKFLERIPDDKLDWKPHPKSMSAGQLAFHIASIPGRVLEMALLDEMSVPDFNRAMPQPAGTKEILAALDESIATVRKLLPTVTDDRMQAIWRMKQEGRELLALPRIAVLRSIMLNHWYQHRGQLGVYLRLLGAKVPSSYGPSADELPDFLPK